MKKILLILSICVLCLNSLAQDSITIKNLKQMQVGVYKTMASFFSKKPDIEKLVKAVVHYIKDKKSDSSVAYGYVYEFADSTKVNLNVFGFFDGENMYVQSEKKIFFKFEGFGRHPYIHVREAKDGFDYPTGTSLSGINYEIMQSAFFLILDEIRKRKVCLHYFNRKHHLVKATPEGVGFLLKKDKDLFDGYGNESKKTEEIMLKYINKMNERYPDL